MSFFTSNGVKDKRNWITLLTGQAKVFSDRASAIPVNGYSLSPITIDTFESQLLTIKAAMPGAVYPKYYWDANYTQNYNCFVNTNAPATQTRTFSALGTYTVSLKGSGSIAVAPAATNAAVISASGTATSAVPFTFTVTTAGDITFTVDGTVTEPVINVGSTALPFRKREDTTIPKALNAGTDGATGDCTITGAASITIPASLPNMLAFDSVKNKFTYQFAGEVSGSATHQIQTPITQDYTQMSVYCAVKQNLTGATRHYWSKASTGIRFGINTNGAILLSGNTGAYITANNVIQAGNYYIIAILIDGTNIPTLYVNGSLVSMALNGATAFTRTPDTQPFVWGRNGGTHSGFMNHMLYDPGALHTGTEAINICKAINTAGGYGIPGLA